MQETHPGGNRRDRRRHRQALRQEEGHGGLSETPQESFDVHIEPGGHLIRVPPGENVLTAALAAGIPLSYSCRAGRCGSCKAKLLAGRIEYPSGSPPGITALEISNGEVLLCQARPRSDLTIEARRVPVRVSSAAACEIVALEPLPLRALRLRLRYVEGKLDAHPGQFVDVRNHAGDAERLAVIGAGAGVIELECGDDGSVLRCWLEDHAVAGSTLRVAGPFDRPR
ncbi:MAG: 2Fe-2S iron-sulfur cluster-binding protein [Pseudomonadota bacterium]